jgi:hypothetical protein
MYSGRRWLPGGSVFLEDGPEVAVRRSVGRCWRLEVVGPRHRVAEFCDPGHPTAALTARLLSAEVPNAPLVLMTAWAVVMLERRLPGPPGTGGT